MLTCNTGNITEQNKIRSDTESPDIGVLLGTGSLACLRTCSGISRETCLVGTLGQLGLGWQSFAVHFVASSDNKSEKQNCSKYNVFAVVVMVVA